MPLLISNGFTPCSASSLVMNTWTHCSVFFLQHNPFSAIAMFACSEKLWQNLGDSTGVTPALNLIVVKPFPGFWKMLESLRQQEAHSIREKAGHWSMLLLMGCISNIIGIKVFWKVWHLKRRVKYLCWSCFVGKDLRRQVGFPCFF